MCACVIGIHRYTSVFVCASACMHTLDANHLGQNVTSSTCFVSGSVATHMSAGGSSSLIPFDFVHLEPSGQVTFQTLGFTIFSSSCSPKIIGTCSNVFSDPRGCTLAELRPTDQKKKKQKSKN